MHNAGCLGFSVSWKSLENACLMYLVGVYLDVSQFQWPNSGRNADLIFGPVPGQGCLYLREVYCMSNRNYGVRKVRVCLSASVCLSPVAPSVRLSFRLYPVFQSTLSSVCLPACLSVCLCFPHVRPPSLCTTTLICILFPVVFPFSLLLSAACHFPFVCVSHSVSLWSTSQPLTTGLCTCEHTLTQSPSFLCLMWPYSYFKLNM